jgi:hypothetical protein
VKNQIIVENMRKCEKKTLSHIYSNDSFQCLHRFLQKKSLLFSKEAHVLHQKLTTEHEIQEIEGIQSNSYKAKIHCSQCIFLCSAPLFINIPKIIATDG